MSLARFALRYSAVRALDGRTLVGDNLRDSAIGAIDIGADGALRTSEDQPFVAIYTDESTVAGAPRRDLRQNGSLDFVAEFGITTAMTATDPETGESVYAGVPTTDAGIEAMLDLLDRQITIALTDPGNEWAEIWRRIGGDVEKIERRRASSQATGARLAARQMRITLGALPDPVPGQPLAETSPWIVFRTAIEAEDPDLLTLIDALMGTPSEALTSAQVRSWRGLTEAEANALRVNAPEYAAAVSGLVFT